MHSVNPRKNFRPTLGLVKRSIRSGLALTALVLAFLVLASQGQSKKNVLMIIEIGQSHPAPALVTNQILSALGSDPRFDAELHWENLDAIDISDDARNELRDGIVRKYRNLNWDLIVLVGPDPLRLFAEPSRTFYPVSLLCSVAVPQDRLTKGAPIPAPQAHGYSGIPRRRWKQPSVCCQTRVRCSWSRADPDTTEVSQRS